MEQYAVLAERAVDAVAPAVVAVAAAGTASRVKESARAGTTRGRFEGDICQHSSR
jgi:hypothetical protein